MPVNSFENYPMSWKPILDKTKKPLYVTLAKQLENDIISGTLHPGMKLPPQRELADFLDINVSTVSKAFKVCELKGFLSAIVGSGTFVTYDALTNMYLLNEGKHKNSVNMGAILTNEASYEHITAQLKNMVNEADYAKWFNYGKQDEMIWQKDAALNLMHKGGFLAKTSDILFANGGQNAITAILASLCQYGDKIATDPHTYSGIKTAAAMLGIQLVPIRLEDGEMSLDALTYACKNDQLKGIYLIPEYQNPTTHKMSLSRRASITEIAKEYNIFIVEDATFHLISKEPIAAIASFAPEHTIYISTLSKMVSPGLRIAYLYVPMQYKEALSKALYNFNICVPPLLADLAARLIVSNQFDKIIEENRRNAIQRNALVDHYLAKYDCHGDETSIFRWLHLPSSCTGSKFEALALEHDVEVYAAERFTVGNSVPAKAVRLAITSPQKKEELERGLIILQKLLKTV